MNRGFLLIVALFLGTFFPAQICSGELHGTVSLTTQSSLGRGDIAESIYSPILSMNFQYLIARGTSIAAGFSALMNYTSIEGFDPTYRGMFFPSFSFITTNSQYSLNAGYSSVFNYGESEYPFNLDELTQTRSLYSMLSLTPLNLPAIAIKGGRTRCFSEDATSDNRRDSIGVDLNYSPGNMTFSSAGGWDKFIDYTNVSGSVPFEENNYNESLSINLNLRPTSGILIGQNSGVGGFQSRRGFGNDVDINRNINYYSNTTISARMTEKISSSGSFFWNRMDRETQTDGVVTRLGKIESFGMSGGLTLELYEFLTSNLNYRRQWQPQEDMVTDSKNVELKIIPFNTLETSLVYGVSQTNRESDRVMKTNTATITATGKPYERVDLNSIFQYSKSREYTQDITITTWKIGPRIKSRLIENSVVKSLDTEAGYNRQWQIIAVGGEPETLVVDVLDVTVDSSITAVIGVTGKWILNNKPEGRDLTQQYSMEWNPVKEVRANFGFSHVKGADGSVDENISARLNWNFRRSLAMTVSCKGERDRDNADQPWDESFKISASVSARF